MKNKILKDGESVVLSLKEARELIEGDFWHPDPEKDAQFDASNRRKGTSLEKHPSVSTGFNTSPAPAKENKFSTMAKGSASPKQHGSIEDAHLHAHLQALKTTTPHSVIHNGVKVATHTVIDGQHHVEIH